MTTRRPQRVHTAPQLRRHHCPHGCGEPVDLYRTPTGLDVALETTPPTVGRELRHRRTYEYRGPRVGWVSKFDPTHTRTWRELRVVHRCATPHHIHTEGTTP